MGVATAREASFRVSTGQVNKGDKLVEEETLYLTPPSQSS